MITAGPTDPGTGRLPYALISALGIAQIVAWGSFFYVFVSLTVPMTTEFGWTKTQVNGALSVVLAVTGLCAYARGRWIDLYGGRALMTGAALAGAALLLGWSHIDQLWQLYAISIGIGVVSSMLLYDAAFAVVARMLGADYGKAIIMITLFGGLASTVFVPLTEFLVNRYGWREALQVLAAIQIPFCAGIPFLLLRNRETLGPAQTGGGPPLPRSIRPALAQPAFWLLALSFVSFAFMFTSLVFNIIPMLRETGFTTAEAVAAYAVIGPSQLAGRVSVLMLQRVLSLTDTGMIGTLVPVLAVIVLIVLPAHSPLVFVFACAFGSGMGINTIVQATAAPEFFGRAGYGVLQGSLMFPVYLAQAGTPLLAAWIWQINGNYQALEIVLLTAAGVSAVAFWLAAKHRPDTFTLTPESLPRARPQRNCSGSAVGPA